MLKHTKKNFADSILEIEDLDFHYLPAFADYILEKRFDDFTNQLLYFAKELQLPLEIRELKEPILNFPAEYAKDLLVSFSKNKAKQYVDNFIQRWKAVEEPGLMQTGLLIEDISKGDFILRKLFRDFLLAYTQDLVLRVNILEEVDRFASYQEDIRYREIFDLKQKKINESTYFFDRLGETSPGIMSLFNLADRKRDFTHHKLFDELGYSLKEGAELQYGSLVHPDDLPELEKHLKHLLTIKDKEVVSSEMRVKNKAGNYIWFRSYETVFKRDINNLPLQILIVSFNIDKEKNTLLELEKREKQLEVSKNELSVKNTELELKNKELSSFNYIASHDLQEPLRKIRTYSNMIIEKNSDSLNENTVDFLNRIIRSATHMQHLIDDLLMFSRTTSGDKVFTTTDLNTLFEEVKVSMKLLLDEEDATVVCDPLPTIDVIPFQFHQLFANMLSNSVKYRKKDVKPSIHISARKATREELEKYKLTLDSTYWVISMQDNGIGFEQKYADKIFELFQRLHPKSEYSGTGIGLAICKRIAENHHGVIVASSEQGEGAVFSVYLPEKVELKNDI